VKQLCRMAVAVGALLVSLFALSGPAGAAPPGYPPSTGSNTSCSVSVSVVLRTTITVTVTCTFAPGKTITITLNGAPYSTATAPASGVLIETFTATDPHISLNGGPAVATSYDAVNTFVATGANPSGGTNTATTLVTIPSPAAAAAPTSATAQPFAFSGADIAAMTIGGLALIALGFVFVVFSRRRKASASIE
jgi:hypothetical protein